MCSSDLLEHLLYAFALKAELATVPAKILEQWAASGSQGPDENFRYSAVNAQGQALKPIPYKEIDINGPWESFDLRHELTTRGIEKFGRLQEHASSRSIGQAV